MNLQKVHRWLCQLSLPRIGQKSVLKSECEITRQVRTHCSGSPLRSYRLPTAANEQPSISVLQHKHTTICCYEQ